MHPLSSSSAFYGYMREHNVDFIGGDFDMSAFSKVGDVFFGRRILSTWQFNSVGTWCTGGAES